MAKLLNLHKGQVIYLRAMHLIGRHSTSVDTVLNNPKASRIHATICWDGQHWTLQDTSSNGTFVNATKMVPNSFKTLAVKDRIYFANPESGVWVVEDLSPPKCMLVPENFDGASILLDKALMLPDEKAPEIMLYKSPSGGWLCESDNGIVKLNHGSKVGVRGMLWSFDEAIVSAETMQLEAQTNELANISVKFRVSQDEEHVWMDVLIHKQQFELGERSHHYLLLMLARKYQQDTKDGFSSNERGWYEKEQLLKMMDLEEVNFNMMIYRFKKQLISSLPESMYLPPFIERRKGAIRFVCENIIIEGGCV